MSLLRLYCCFPSTSHLYTEPQQQQSHGAPFVSLLQKQQKQHYNYFFPLSSSPFHAYTFPITPKKVSPFVFHFSATTQDPFVDSSSAAAANTEQREEEYSKTRLVAQNVPWTSTHEDIRALFEQHGTVLDIEVSFYIIGVYFLFCDMGFGFWLVCWWGFLLFCSCGFSFRCIPRTGTGVWLLSRWVPLARLLLLSIISNRM